MSTVRNDGPRPVKVTCSHPYDERKLCADGIWWYVCRTCGVKLSKVPLSLTRLAILTGGGNGTRY